MFFSSSFFTFLVYFSSFLLLFSFTIMTCISKFNIKEISNYDNKVTLYNGSRGKVQDFGASSV